MALYIVTVVSASPANLIGKRTLIVSCCVAHAIQEVLKGFKGVTTSTATLGDPSKYGYLFVNGKGYSVQMKVELDPCN